MLSHPFDSLQAVAALQCLASAVTVKKRGIVGSKQATVFARTNLIVYDPGQGIVHRYRAQFYAFTTLSPAHPARAQALRVSTISVTCRHSSA